MLVDYDEVMHREAYFNLVAYHWDKIRDRVHKIIGEENTPKTVTNSVDEYGYDILIDDIKIENILWTDKQKEELLELLDYIYENKIYEPEAVLNFEQTMLA